MKLPTGAGGPSANAGVFAAPSRAMAELGGQVSRAALQYGQSELKMQESKAKIDFDFAMAEKKQATLDKDAELSERIIRGIKEIENDPAYTTASDAKTAVQLFRDKVLGEIDGLSMTPNQKATLKLSANKSIAIQGINAEQKAYNRGLVESGASMTALIDSKLDLLNSLDPSDPRVAMIKQDIDSYREEAAISGFVSNLPTAYQTRQGTEDAIAGRQTTNVITKENVTEQDLDDQLERLNESFRKGDISDSSLRSNTKILTSKKAAMQLAKNASQPEVLQAFKDIANDITYDESLNYSDLETAVEEAESMTGRFAGLTKKDRPAIVSILKGGMRERAVVEDAELAENLTFEAMRSSETGRVSVEAEQALERLFQINPPKALEASKKLHAATTAHGYVAGLELASNAEWQDQISAMVRERDSLVDAASAEGATDEDRRAAIVMNEALVIAETKRQTRMAKIKEDPRAYYMRTRKKFPPQSPSEPEETGAGYLNWARSVGVPEDELTIFTNEQKEEIAKRISEASPMGKVAIFSEVKQQYPGVSDHLIVQSFRKAGMTVIDNFLMVAANNPVSTDLQVALSFDDKALKELIGDTDVEKNIAAALVEEMMPFNQSVTGTVGTGAYASRVGVGAEGNLGGKEAFVRELNGAALKLAKYYATKGMSAKEAAKMAARIHTSQFVYGYVNNQPIRIPSQNGSVTQANADRFAAALSSVVSELSIDQVKLQSGADEATQKTRTGMYLDRVKRKGSWVTNGASTGAYLVDELGVPVLKPNGDRFFIPFDSVSNYAEPSLPDVFSLEDPAA
jgi:hypothetical protein